jgi:phospholipid/cholesterol/gamma-HCH transport system substrate-binding protein
MYASRTTQLIVGVFALLGIAALGYLSITLGHVELFRAPGYELYANFDNLGGLKAGDLVEIAGVHVGKVEAIALAGNRAHVTLHLHQGVDVDSEAIAEIDTSGLLGDKYISVELGGGDTLKPGDTIRQTQSAFVLEKAIGQLINNMGSGSSSSSASGSGANPKAGNNCPCPNSQNGK